MISAGNEPASDRVNAADDSWDPQSRRIVLFLIYNQFSSESYNRFFTRLKDRLEIVPFLREDPAHSPFFHSQELGRRRFQESLLRKSLDKD